MYVHHFEIRSAKTSILTALLAAMMVLAFAASAEAESEREARNAPRVRAAFDFEQSEQLSVTPTAVPDTPVIDVLQLPPIPQIALTVFLGSSSTTTEFSVRDALASTSLSSIGTPIAKFVKCTTIAHIGWPLPGYETECPATSTPPGTTTPPIDPPGTTTPPGGNGGGGDPGDGTGGGGGEPNGNGGGGGGGDPAGSSGGSGGTSGGANGPILSSAPGQVLGAVATPEDPGVGGGDAEPGVPNTGIGGHATNIAILLVSFSVMIGSLTILLRGARRSRLLFSR